MLSPNRREEIDHLLSDHSRLDPLAPTCKAITPHVPVQWISRKPGASWNRVALLAETLGSPSRMVQCLCQWNLTLTTHDAGSQRRFVAPRRQDGATIDGLV